MYFHEYSDAHQWFSFVPIKLRQMKVSFNFLPFTFFITASHNFKEIKKNLNHYTTEYE